MHYTMSADEEVYDVSEIVNILVIYQDFNKIRNYFGRYPTEDNARAILKQIRRVSIGIPENIRISLPDYFKLTSEDLSELESKCHERLKLLKSA